jgi:hypothetical protein
MQINMKTNSIILVLFACVFACGQVQAQEDNLPYRPFQSFKNDTIRYLDYNFTLRREQYAGKTVGDLLKDLQLPVLYISDISSQLPFKEEPWGVVSMNLVIQPYRDKNEDWSDDSKDYYIGLSFKKPLADRNFIRSLTPARDAGAYLSHWTPQVYEKLKNMELHSISANELLFPERQRILDDLRHSESEKDRKELVKQFKEIIKAEKERWKNQVKAEKELEKQQKELEKELEKQEKELEKQEKKENKK